jgi:ABC-type polysaccharide/polyol phosphate export permease
MESITKELSNPVWWVTVVIAGIIINLVAAFLFKKMEGSIPNASSKLKYLSEKRKQERKKRIENLKSDKQAVYLASLDEIRHRIRMVQSTVLGLSIFVFTEFGTMHLNIPSMLISVMAFFSALSIFVGWISHRRSMSILGEIRESQVS